MKKISVVDENGALQEISAGVTKYSELTDSPISIKTLNTSVAADGTLSVASGHEWSETEVLNFCQHADDGRYDIFTAKNGTEILLVDSTNVQVGRRYRRIMLDYDSVWDSDTSQWIQISDTSAKALIYRWLNESDFKTNVVVGEDFIIQLYYYSNVGTGRVTATVNDTAYTIGSVSSGNIINVNLTQYIKDGANKISIKFANDATTKYVPELNVTGINLTYSPTFNQYQAFSSDVTFNYSCAGSSKKVVHFDITDASGNVSTKEIEHEAGYYGASASLPASYFKKGANKIATYMYAKDDFGNVITTTKTTVYNIPFLTDNAPLLMVYYDAWTGLKQYGSISVPYYVWSTQTGALDSINFSIQVGTTKTEYKYETADAGATVNYLQYNTAHNWIITSLPTSFDGTTDLKATFAIVGKYGSTSTNTFSKSGVSIASSSDAMQTVGNYKFNFSAADLTRALSTWHSKGDAPLNMVLSGFNWNSDGVASDSAGNPCLHFSSAAKGAIAHPSSACLLGDYTKLFTLEFDFMVDAAAAEEPIIKYYDSSVANPDLYGLTIYPNKSIFKYVGGTSEINYIAGERTHIAYTICNKTVTDADPATPTDVKNASLLYLFVYINGILSQMKAINSATEFANSSYTPNTMVINAAGNDFYLYAVRGYNFALTSAQVLQNYISGIGSASAKETMYLKNKLYSATKVSGVPGEYLIDFDSVKGTIPCVVVFSDTMPDTKSTVACRTVYYEADGNTKLTQWKNNKSMATTYYYTRETTSSPWKRAKAIEYGGQGTSSLAYPRKNFKFKYGDKFYIKEHTLGEEKTFTFKAD